MANKRSCSNFVNSIVFNGAKVTNPGLLPSGIRNYFFEHYKNVPWRRPRISGLGLSRLSSEQRDALEGAFSYEEVWATVCGCDGNKVPGPDGLNLNFIKANWEMAFVKNRQIFDSLVIAEEIIHKWKNNREGGVLLKLDFEKAYDKVDHLFLDGMMEDIGFGDRWRNWIRWCISSSSLSVLVNGSPTSPFGVERGLRQGDHLSPFLFNIVVEDDTILFLKPKKDYILNVRRILRCFELASGLSLNFHKSGVVRVGTKLSEVEDWVTLFRCKKATLPILYLGLPLGGNASTKIFWKSLLLRIERRLSQWKRKFLSKGGRLIMIKSVISSLPVFFMSVYRISAGVAKSIEKWQRSFF
ncbi:hypothetical protein Dsin_022978 [Dipteronia sinensis]|uniref:Reverse transcriptase domain-containing protein n=1 Tax=Dipteronia sinensis TaxID=43782 RepID=A0AAE0A2S9_9ROSI|nr:hypothetical protein Dsin_022978 [Dipteronia sinensis]